MDEGAEGTVYQDDSFSHTEDRHESEPMAMEKLACENCRQRKVKCDRVYPCSHCVKTKAPCNFPAAQKPRAKRQRVLISSIYENKIDRIAQRIEELNQSIQHLGLTQSSTSPHTSQLPHSHPSPYSSQPTPSSSAATPADPNLVGNGANEGPSKPEYEGESSLFSHAVFATRFLQNAVNNNPSSEVALEMVSVLDALRNVVDSQKKQTDTLDSLYPNARPLPPGASLRQLPLPATDKALACIRMAQESPQIQILWLLEFQTIAQFTTHFIKVCSPGPATDADLIIVNAGLYWLFCECANASTDPYLKQDYDAQALICRDSLETILSRLPFHLPTSVEYVFALSMASLYCLQKCKISAAWNFICVASHLSYSLGLHSSLPLQRETPESKRQKTRLFWTIYTTEKMLSLQLGRSSMIREKDITVLSRGHEISQNVLLNEAYPIWIAFSTLQGRIYDEIYSPDSFAQPESIRTSRAMALAAEAKKLIQVEDEIQARHLHLGSQAFGDGLQELLWRADRVTGLSMLTLIYRVVPADKPGSSVFCEECISSARDAIREHEKCIAIVAEKGLQSSYFQLYVNWALIQSPFIPFIVLFCNIIETSDSTDLDHLKRLVETLQAASSSCHYLVCQKQLTIFKALYDVVVKYFEVKSSAMQGGTLHPDAAVLNAYPGASNMGLLSSVSQAGLANTPLGQIPIYGSRNAEEAEQSQLLGEFGMQSDPPGAELATWFYTNHQMMKMFDDV